MTDLDPKSPAAWTQAEAIAATVAKGKPEKRSDALPFLFKAEDPPWVLVHKGQVVRERGAKVAGEYLRDLGIIQGKGPGIEDVVTVLTALDALPPVTGVKKESYIHVPGDSALSGVTARVYYDGLNARVTLSYFVGDPTPIKGAGGPPGPGDTVGAPDPDYKPTVTKVRPVARCTLTISKSGDASWTIEQINLPA